MAVAILILTCALWGLSFPVIKALQLDQALRVPDAPEGFLAAWIQLARFSLAALLLLIFVVRQPRPTRSELHQGALLALWGGLGMGIQADALAFTSASTSAFLTQAYCVFLPLWATLRSRRKPSGRILGATLLVIIGSAVLSGVRPGHIAIGRGEIETLVAAFFFTFQILTLEDPRFRHNRGTSMTFVMCGGIALFSLPVVLLTAPSPAAILDAGAAGPAILMVLVLALVCTVGAFMLMNTWQRCIPATEAGLIYTSEPVFTAAYALFLPALLSGMTGILYPNESLTPALFAGGSLILAANVWIQWRKPPHGPAVAPAP